MKKVLFLLLVTSISYGQALFDKGIKVTTNINDTIATKVVVKSANNVYNYQDIVKFQKEKGFLSTGLIKNGLISANGDPTKFNITAGVGIISNFDNPENPISNIVRFPAFNSITPTYLTTGNITYVAINSTPAVVMQATPFTPVQRRSLIILGAVIHSNLTTINVLNNISAPTNADTNQLHDFMEAVGALNITGNKYTANGSNLQLNKSAGVLFKLGSNFAVDWKNPHEIAQTGGTAISFRYRTQNGTESADMTSISPALYDLNNVLTTVPNNKFTIQTVTIFQTGLTRIQWGQTIYDDLATAKNALLTRDFVVESNIKENGVTRAYIIVRNSTTSLQNVADAYISEAQKFGGVASGGVALTLANIVTALGYTPENLANKQNSLAVDGTGVKYPTVDAINSNVVKLTGDQTITGTKTFDIVKLKENTINSNTYRLTQPMAGDDNWSIYGRYSELDRGELVFEVGDNGNDFNTAVPNSGQKFIFRTENSGGGIAKDNLVIEYNAITANANLTATSYVKSGGLSSQFLKANGSVDATTYQPLLTNPITGSLTTSTIPIATGANSLGNSSLTETAAAIEFFKSFRVKNSLGTNLTLYTSTEKIIGTGSNIDTNIYAYNNEPISLWTGNLRRFSISPLGNALFKTTTDNGVDAIQTPLTISFAAGTTANQGVIKSQLDLKADLTSVPVGILEFNTTDRTVWNNGKNNIDGNLSFGDEAMRLATGNSNTSYGNYSARVMTTANDNAIFGNSSMRGLTTGSGNLSAGNSSGWYIADSVTLNTNSSNSVFLGASSFPLADNQTNQIVIGHTAIGKGSNTATLGNDSITDTYLKGVVNQSKSYTVATLPVGKLGDFTWVTDATAPTYLGILIGGGTVKCPVFYNGTNWVSH